MKVKQALILVAFVAVALVIFWPGENPEQSRLSRLHMFDSDDPAVRTAAVARAEAPVATPAAPPLPPAGSAGLEPEMEAIRFVIRDYRMVFGQNPAGGNRDITRALLGANPRQTKFISANDVRLNQRGELCDQWGTPYLFHALSGGEMEIRSAGPDQQLQTADDVVRP